jgi:hypothetical protein
MEQNIEVLTIIGAVFRSSAKIFFGFCIEATCGADDSNKKGDSKWCR